METVHIDNFLKRYNVLSLNKNIIRDESKKYTINDCIFHALDVYSLKKYDNKDYLIFGLFDVEYDNQETGVVEYNYYVDLEQPCDFGYQEHKVGYLVVPLNVVYLGKV